MVIGCCDSNDESGNGGLAANPEIIKDFPAKSPASESTRCEGKSPGSGSANSRAGKNCRNNGSKTGYPSLNAINKSASHIRKPPRRSASPVNWFPRKKTDSFLKRKLKLLQEREGMNSTLSETLGNANPHYTRIAREKIAASAAAKKAMEARRAAMIEASWCRILHAARIHIKDAEDRLEKAEKYVAEAFEEAAAMGVMMYDRPDCPRRSCQIEISAVTGGASTHKVTASFETAFEVDKEVTGAVKKAFMRLAHCTSSSNKEEFRDLLRKISQNPEEDQTEPDISLQCGSIPEEQELPAAGLSSDDSKDKCESGMKRMSNPSQLSSDNERNFQSSQCLVDMMFDRLKCLPEDEIASLALIAATSGLNAALLEMENGKRNNNMSDTTFPVPRKLSGGKGGRRFSSVSSFIHGHTRRKDAVTELPSLDKFLVKHVTRLEKEVEEAKNLKKNEQRESMKHEFEKRIPGNGWAHPNSSPDSLPDLGDVLVKHVSRLEKDVLAAKNSSKDVILAEDREHVSPSHCSETEGNMDMQSGKPSGDSGKGIDQLSEKGGVCLLGTNIDDKENMDLNELPSSSCGESTASKTSYFAETQKNKKHSAQTGYSSGSTTAKHHILRSERARLETLKAFSAQGEDESPQLIALDKILTKHVHRLEKVKTKALERKDWETVQRNQKGEGTVTTAEESLDKILVKHVSRLEREKAAALETGAEVPLTSTARRRNDQQSDSCAEGLDQVLGKHQSRLEKAKLAASQESADRAKPPRLCTWREARERELLEAWGGLSLGNSVKPHLSRLEREKAAWKKAEQEEKEQRRARESCAAS